MMGQITGETPRLWTGSVIGTDLADRGIDPTTDRDRRRVVVFPRGPRQGDLGVRRCCLRPGGDLCRYLRVSVRAGHPLSVTTCERIASRSAEGTPPYHLATAKIQLTAAAVLAISLFERGPCAVNIESAPGALIRRDEVEVAVLGAGNGSCAVAFDWAQHGHNVRLFATAEYPGEVAAIAGRGELVSTGELSGAAPISYADMTPDAPYLAPI